MMSTNKMSLKAFWEAVEQRLAACSADELRSILRAMARETSPSARRDFLVRLELVDETAFTESQVIHQQDLLNDIEDLAQEFDQAVENADPWEEEHDDWYDDYDDDDSLGTYGEFVKPLVDFFDRAEAAFDYGEISLARDAYEALFETLQTEDDYGRGIGHHDLVGVDIGEAVARYLRAIYETEPIASRPQAVYGQMQKTLGWRLSQRPMLEDLVQISPRPLPDRESFLTDWIAFLRTLDAPSGSSGDVWLREAVRLSQGIPGLEALARAEGQTRPRAYLDWFAALEKEGDHRQVLAAAQEALQTLPSQLPIRAAVADHLCTAATQLDDVESLRRGRWEAFKAKPTLSRLLDLWDGAEGGESRTALMQEAVRYMRGYTAPPSVPLSESPRYGDSLERPARIGTALLAHACLLAGEWDQAHQLAARGKVLGWSSGASHQGVVVAAFLILLSGEVPAPSSNLAQLWGWNVQDSLSIWDRGYGEADSTYGRLDRAYVEWFNVATLSTGQQGRFLPWCLDVANKRVDAIVGNQYRKSYNKAAVLAVACAETLRSRGDQTAADALVGDVRGRFPRHSAFQREMRAAIARM